MTKKRKTLLIVLGAVLLILIAGAVGLWVFVHTCFLEIDPIEGLIVWADGKYEEYEEGERLHDAGYRINYPSFRNKTQWNLENDVHVYAVFNNTLESYARDIAKKYQNYAKLDYTVDVKPNETLTVAFTGTGYFYDGRDPVPLEKTFVFDIKDMSPEHLPTLISE